MIKIKKSPTSDSRSCDFKKVTQAKLKSSSRQHISDVNKAIKFFISELDFRAKRHDMDKLTDINGFYENFKTGFLKHDWLDRHREMSRHHLLNKNGIPSDVNLLDVLELIADWVMASKARSGRKQVRKIAISNELLQRAFRNTVKELASNVVVVSGLEESKNE